MQSCTADGWHEVIEDHRLTASFCLRTLAGVVDDERIKMGDGTKGEFGPAVRTQSDALAGKPFGAAVFPHMQHRLRSVLATQPQVLGQVTVRWRQIGRMQISDLVRVVTTVRLQENNHMTEPQPMNSEAQIPIKVECLIRRSPTLFDQTLGRSRHCDPPGLIVSQGKMVQWRPVLSLRSVGAASQQLCDEGITIRGKRLRAEFVALLIQPAENVGDTGGRIEPYSIGNPTIPDRVVGQHHRDAPFCSRCLSQINPTCGMLHQPVDPVRIGLLGGYGRGERSSRGPLLTEGARSGGDAAIEFRHHHLQRKIQGIQSPTAAAPAFTGSRAG